MSWEYRFNQFLWGSLDWLFPPVCGGCDRPGFRWCPNCTQLVRLIPEPVCITCGLPVRHPGLCINCRSSHPAYQAMRSWLVFVGPIRLALHKLKYRRNIALGEALAQHMVDYVDLLGWPVDVVVPVPLGKARMKERGYNQVGLVAMPLASIKNWRYESKALVRVRETRTQVGLSEAERKQNVSGAFRSDPARMADKTVLVMDDVTTPGATLLACADACMESGAKAVYALTIARALPHHGLNIV